MTDPAAAIHFVEQLSYFGVFVSLLFSGYLFPIPEEILLLVFGYLVSVNIMSPVTVLIVAFLALLISDNVFYWLLSRDVPVIRHFKKDIGDMPFLKKRFSEEHSIGMTIFVLRFAVGLRMLSPIIASAKHASHRTFFLYDTLALVIYTPLVIFLGFYFHSSILTFITKVESVQHGIAMTFFVVLWALLFFFVYRRLYHIHIKAAAKEKAISHGE